MPGHGLYISELQQRPVELLMIPANTPVSIPSASPKAMASLTPTMEIASSRLLQILAICPVPTSPQWTMLRPICANTGCRVANSSGVAPTIKVSVPAVAPPVPPETGASAMATPCLAAAAATSRAVCGSMVLQSTAGTPLPIPASTPSSPSQTLRTCTAAGSMVITSSAPSAACRAEALMLPPSCASSASTVLFRSTRFSEWPALIRLRAIGAPMLPRPINAIFMAGSLTQVDGGVHAVVDAVVIEPAAGDRLGLRVELHHLLAIRTEVAEFRTTGTGEAEERHRHRNRDVDPDLADVDFTLEFTRRRTALGEQARAVAKRVGVDQCNGLIKGVDFQHHQHRTKDFLGVDLHLGGDTREQGRADEVALLETWNADAATVQLQLGAFLDAAFDQVKNPRLGLFGNHRADIRTGFAAGIHFEFLRQRFEVRQPLFCGAHQHHHRGGHAALARRAETSADQGIERLFAIGVRQHYGVVLGTHHRLHTLAVFAGQVINVGADRRRTDKRNGLDVFVGAQCIHHVLATVHHVEYACRNAGFKRQFHQQHGRQRILFRRF